MNKYGLYIGLLAAFITAGLPATAQSLSTGYKKIPATAYDSLRKILAEANAGLLKDTVIIHYQFPHNAEPPAYNDELIQQNTTNSLRRLHCAMAQRKNISLLHFTFPGDTASTTYNNLIREDIGFRIQQLVFEKDTRANSILLLP
ncbi:MAG: hypothetical protein EOO03_06245, partial [Chitinophagaceae bacterium]